MPLRDIEQTSKTILIEEFYDPEQKNNLKTLLLGEREATKDRFAEIIEERLEVRSFKDFCEKFMPKVWEWSVKNSDPALPAFKVCYSTKKPEKIWWARELKLDENSFYQMVKEIYEKKGKSSKSNLEFKYSAAEKLLAPSGTLEKTRSIRGRLQYLWDEIEKLGDDSPSETERYFREIQSIRKEIVEQCKGSSIFLLQLALADTQNRLSELESISNDGEVNNVGIRDKTPIPCRIGFSETGEIEAIPIEYKGDEEGKNLPDKKNYDKLRNLIERDYNNYIGSHLSAEKIEQKELDTSEAQEILTEKPKDYLKELVLSVYCAQREENLQKEELLDLQKQYMALYQYSQEEFVWAISSTVEKMIGVQAFFEQASMDGNLPEPVIVTNCKANKLLDSETKKRFEWYIKEFGNETRGNKIWFAVIPAIGNKDFMDSGDYHFSRNTKNLMDMDLYESPQIETKAGEPLVDLDTLEEILKIMKEGKIITFFNYRANAQTAFDHLTKEIVAKYEESLKHIAMTPNANQEESGNPYAVFSYPNFTIIPNEKTSVKVDNANSLSIPGVYIDSAYIAAGLVVASQNPDYLRKKGFKSDPNTPCVRFDLEDDSNRYKMLTNMNREGKTLWPVELDDVLKKNKFGFCFCGNYVIYNNEKIERTYVYTARTMSSNKEGKYIPIYKRLTLDFVGQYLKVHNNNIRQLQKDIREWKLAKPAVNKILLDNEDITIEPKDGKTRVKVKFQNGESEVDVEIISEENQED